MAQHGIQRELEVWTTFVLKHNDEVNDYKFAETLSETVSALKDCYRELCFEKAGTTRQELDWTKLSAFIVAVYTVTSEETMTWRLQKEQEVDSVHAADQPYISFPWIFAKELGYIAKGRSPGAHAFLRMNETMPSLKKQSTMCIDSQDSSDMPPKLSVVNNGEERIVQTGDVLSVNQGAYPAASAQSVSAEGTSERDRDDPQNATSTTSTGQKTIEATSPEGTSNDSSAASQTDEAPLQAAPHTTPSPPVRPVAENSTRSDAEEASEVTEEEAFIEPSGFSSALKDLEALVCT
ncbi:hypothetical protein KC336_g20654 [Hortaea werneckii]|nr:hypothetical protein KC336_g20654 [Hortaea werneckii]